MNTDEQWEKVSIKIRGNLKGPVKGFQYNKRR